MIGEIFPTDAKWCWIDLTGAHEDDRLTQKRVIEGAQKPFATEQHIYVFT